MRETADVKTYQMARGVTRARRESANGRPGPRLRGASPPKFHPGLAQPAVFFFPSQGAGCLRRTPPDSPREGVARGPGSMFSPSEGEGGGGFLFSPGNEMFSPGTRSQDSSVPPGTSTGAGGVRPTARRPGGILYSVAPTPHSLHPTDTEEAPQWNVN